MPPRKQPVNQPTLFSTRISGRSALSASVTTRHQQKHNLVNQPKITDLMRKKSKHQGKAHQAEEEKVNATKKRKRSQFEQSKIQCLHLKRLLMTEARA